MSGYEQVSCRATRCIYRKGWLKVEALERRLRQNVTMGILLPAL
ncbi:MAG: hypothetical protein AAB385_04475 [Planctomycetota bacterium]